MPGLPFSSIFSSMSGIIFLRFLTNNFLNIDLTISSNEVFGYFTKKFLSPGYLIESINSKMLRLFQL